MSPRKCKEVRSGKTTRVSGGGCWVARWARDRAVGIQEQVIRAWTIVLFQVQYIQIEEYSRKGKARQG